MAASDLKISHLRAFAEVAAAGSFTRAARRADCSQGAVSRRVQALEARLGARLFDRPQARLTAAGRTLLPLAQVLLARHDRLLAELGRQPPPACGERECRGKTEGG